MSGTATAVTPSPTPHEVSVAEAFVSILDLVSRIKDAVDSGQAYYGWEKCQALRARSDRLMAVLDRTLEQHLPLRGQVLELIVGDMAQPYKAGRALYPRTTGADSAAAPVPSAGGVSSAPVGGTSPACAHEPELVNGWGDALCAPDSDGTVVLNEYARRCQHCGAHLIRFARATLDADGFPAQVVERGPWFVTRAATDDSRSWAARIKASRP